MFLVYALILLLGFAFLYANAKEAKYRWASIALFTCVVGGLLAHFVDKAFKTPKLPEEYYNFGNVYSLIIYLFDTYSYYFFPYTFLMFSIAYCMTNSKFFIRHKYKIYVIFLIPILCFYAVFHVYPEDNPYFYIITVWATSYVVLGHSIFIRYIFRCGNKHQRIETIILYAFIAPGTLFPLYTDYILVSVDNFSIWNYHDAISFFIVIVGVFLIFRYGMLGIRIKIEKKDINASIKSAHMGISVINHTIKNELSKISMCIESICLSNNGKDIVIDKSANIIKNSITHLSAVMGRLKKNVQEITIDKKPVFLDDIIESAIVLNKANIQGKNINFIKNYQKDYILLCDAVHMTEVFNNIFKNSIEAMDGGGKIEIYCGLNKKWFFIQVEDNGNGITQRDLPNVLTPFFSTKNRNSNFGLGLAYCYSVMKKHDGLIEISSREKYGTSVFLYFPLQLHKHAE